jgi:hypothetical protein
MTAILAVRIFLAPCFVVAVSLVGRRFGARIGGVVAGAPVVAGPTLLVLSLEHGTSFASRAAVGALLGIVGLAAFVLSYAAIARSLGWLVALFSAYAAFALAIILMRPISVGPMAGLLIACGTLTLTLTLLPRPPHAVGLPPRHPGWDLPLRAVSTAGAVLAITAIASTVGPHLSGLITSLPIITAVLAAFTQVHRGANEAIRSLRGFSVGFFSYAAFCFVVALTVRPLGIAVAFFVATAVALVVQAATVAAIQRRALRMQRLSSANGLGATDST